MLFDSSQYQTGMYPDGANKRSFQEGLEFQDYIVDVLQRRLSVTISLFGSKAYQFVKGESIQGVEIKLDNHWTGTNRLSIELAEKSRQDRPTYAWSGIYRADNTWLYIQGNRTGFFVFLKHQLRWVYETKTAAGRSKIVPARYQQVKGEEFTRKLDRRETDYKIDVKPTVVSYYMPIDWANIYGYFISGA